MATGDSRLTNNARLLAAQELNRRALAKKAAERLAKIEAERKEDEERKFRNLRKRAGADRISQLRVEEDIARIKASVKEKARVAKINAQAIAEKKKAIARTVGGTGTRIETLSGRVVARDTKGKIVGLTNRESTTAIRAKEQIIREVQRREVERTKVTDLERFLTNERALASGQVNRKQLDKQIAERKARGLSKTPQQKALEAKLRDGATATALQKRSTARGSRGAELTATSSQLKKENERSRAKSVTNFGNTQNSGFNSVKGAGASFQARAKDSSIGQINSQLSFLQSKRTGKSKSATQNENVALQIASGNFFTGMSDFALGNILSGGQGNNVRKAPSAKESVGGQARRQAGSNADAGQQAQNLNKFNPFAVVAQQDIPDPVTGVTDRQVQLFREDLARKGEPVPDTSEFFSSGRAPRADDPFNDFAFGNFGGVDTTKSDIEGGDIANPNAVDLSVLEGRGAFFSDTQTQADINKARKKANENKLVQRQTDLGALGRSLDSKNARRGKEIESQHRKTKPRFSGQFSLGNVGVQGQGNGVTVQRNVGAQPTQLNLIPQRALIGGNTITIKGADGKNVTLNQAEIDNLNPNAFKGQEKIDIKQAQSNNFGGFSVIPDSAFVDPRKAQAEQTQAQTKALRDQGGSKGADGRNFGVGQLGNFNQDLVSQSSGLVRATGEAGSTRTFGEDPNQVNLFETIGLGDNVSVNTPQQGRNLSIDLFENIGVGDSVSQSQTKKKAPVKKPTNTKPSIQTQSIFQSPPQSQSKGLNAFGGQQINLVPDFLVGAVPKAQGFFGNIIDSPFGQQAKKAIDNPNQTFQQAQSSANFLIDLGKQTNFLDPTAPTRNLNIKGVTNKAINDDAFSFLLGR